jgi:hypothetical protein
VKRKAYRRRIVSAPVTEGLLATFQQDAQAIEIGLRIGPNAHLVDSALRLLNTVGYAATLKKIERPAVVAIQSAALHLGTVSERFGRTGQWTLTPMEVEQVTHGMQECLRILGKLDVKVLMIAYVKQEASR